MDEFAKIINLIINSNKELSGLKLKAEKGDVSPQIELGKNSGMGLFHLKKII